MHATTQTEPPTCNYEEEIAAQMAIVEKSKKRHEQAMAELGKLREQATKRKAELQRLLEEHTTKIQATEKEVTDLQAANTLVAARLAEVEETDQWAARQHFEETESLKGEITELQIIAN